MALTEDQRRRIKQLFTKLTTGPNSLSKRQAWKRISETMNIGITTARYWSDDRFREQHLQSGAKYRNGSEGKAYYKEWIQNYFSKPEVKERNTIYARLRRSALVAEVLPKVFESRETLPFRDLVDLIEAETGFRFKERTLRKLLLDRYAGSTRGPPVEEIPNEPNSYQLRKAFYKPSRSDDPL